MVYGWPICAAVQSINTNFRKTFRCSAKFCRDLECEEKPKLMANRDLLAILLILTSVNFPRDGTHGVRFFGIFDFDSSFHSWTYVVKCHLANPSPSTVLVD